MNKAIIISGNLAQDHEFIYPYYRLLEEGFKVDVCLLEGKPVQGILGTKIPPNKDQAIKKIDEITEARIDNAAFFDHELSKLSQVSIPKRSKDDKQVFHIYLQSLEQLVHSTCCCSF